jgi:hypothetical protein
MKERNHLEGLDIVGRRLMRYDRRLSLASIWLRVGSSGGFL